MRLQIGEQSERAAQVAVDLGRKRQPEYGRYLDELVPGQVFAHPRGYTFERSEMRAFATTFMQANPIYLNAEVARDHGFADIPASPQHVFNVVLSLGVQNDSEKAIANLGYFRAVFLRPVYAGDTLRALTQVVSRRARGEGKPGVVHIRTLGLDQHQHVVLQYERMILVKSRPGATLGGEGAPPAGAEFPWVEADAAAGGVLPLELPLRAPGATAALSGAATTFEDFTPGEIIVHGNGRTVTDEHLAWTYRVGNTHPLHYDSLYSQALEGPMSGKPIVYGGLVFAWLEGLASRDTTDNALWELGFTAGYHTQPVVSGDTLSAITRVLACDPAPEGCNLPAGVVTLQLIGLKNVRAADALDRFGPALFTKESDKKELGQPKIPEKVFETERRLLIKARDGVLVRSEI